MVRFARLMAAAVLCLPTLTAAEELQVGFAHIDITPAISDQQPVWIAGYGTGRQATGVHDPLLARCVALRCGQ